MQFSRPVCLFYQAIKGGNCPPDDLHRNLASILRYINTSKKNCGISKMMQGRAARLFKGVFERSAAQKSNSSGASSSFHRNVSENSTWTASIFSKAVAGKLANGGFLKPQLLSRAAPYKVYGSHLSTASAAFASTVHAATPIVSRTLVSGGVGEQKQVATWLYVCAGWVFTMVVVGGMTRLTRSGLSMTDWKFTGSLPPMSAEEWEKEFDKYKQSPEYRRVNKGMSLEDFKFIYWMEYAHRMWGRSLGVVFAVPFGYFLAKGYITRALGLRLGALFAMGAGQGLVGWWMVKSGLEEPTSEYAQPRVSPYRLAAHLTSAFVIYAGLLWTALSVSSPEPPSAHLPQPVLQASKRVRAMVLPVAALVGLTAFSGAFVAGNDAGRAYNTFPKMGDHWIPEGVLELQPVIRNFFENTATVQLDHRILATTTLLSIGAVWWAARRLPLLPATSKLLKGAVHMTVLQVSLGIFALLTYVPVPLGVAHQAGALTLFTIMLALAHTLRRPSAGATETSRLLSRLKVSSD